MSNVRRGEPRSKSTAGNKLGKDNDASRNTTLCNRVKGSQCCESCADTYFCTNLLLCDFLTFCTDVKYIRRMKKQAHRPRFQVCNKQVTEERYFEILDILLNEIQILDTLKPVWDLPSNVESFPEMWKKLSLKQISAIFEIPEFKGNEKLFSQITGIFVV